MINIHSGVSVADCITLKTRRLNIDLLDESHIEAFYIGYYDRLCEEHDNVPYNKVESIETALEFFYSVGYRISGNEIFLSELVRKSLPNLEGFRNTILTYLNRMNIQDFLS